MIGFALGVRLSIAAIFSAVSLTAAASAAETLPGEGRSVQPITTGRIDQYFQNYVVQIGLERLGYTVKPYLEAQYPAMHLAVGQGDADYTAVHWNPLHESYYENAGGDKTLVRLGSMVDNAIQGYLIDKKTADAAHITNLGQFKDPKIAQLFDTDGDGKANLTGCNPGWGCEKVIEHHLDAYDLRDRINHNQGEYFALMADTITRYKEGKPILFYTWTPLWVSSVLKPGRDVVWLDVPFSSLPDEGKNADTKLPNGHNTGFGVNTIGVLANKKFADDNPAARRFMELVKIPIDDVNQAILRTHEGEKSLEAIHKLAEEWIGAHQPQFSEWIEAGKEAAAR